MHRELILADRICQSDVEGSKEVFILKRTFYLDQVSAIEQPVGDEFDGYERKDYCWMKFNDNTCIFVLGSFKHWYRRIYTDNIGKQFNLTSTTN